MEPPPGTGARPGQGGSRPESTVEGAAASRTAPRSNLPALLASSPRDDPVSLRFSTWSLVRAVAVIAVGLVAVRVVVAAGTVLWWLAIATAVAGVVHPATISLRRFVPGWVAIVTVIVVGLGFVGIVAYRGFAELSAQFEILRSDAVAAARDIQASRQFGQVAGEFGLVDKTVRFFDNLPVAIGFGGDGGAAATVQSAASSGSALFAIATFAVLMLIFAPRFVQAGLDQIDDRSVRQRVGVLVEEAYGDATRYVWLMAIRAVAVGILGGLVAVAVGLETPTAVGVAFAVMSLIPGLGIVLAAVPLAIFLAVQTQGRAVAVLVAAAVVQAVDAGFVQRRIEAASVHVGPAPTLVAALFGLQLYGIGGLLVFLGATVYGLAVLSRLTGQHDEVFSAMRQLVAEEAAVGRAGALPVAGDGGTDQADDGEPSPRGGDGEDGGAGERSSAAPVDGGAGASP